MVVATGFFDGVHLGHRRVIAGLVRAARERGTESLVLTFWPHPRTVLQKDAAGLRLLSSPEEKKAMLTALGVDRVEVLEFTKEFSRMTTERYLREIIIGKYGGTAVVLGYDNRLGSDGADTEEVARTAGSLGLEVIQIDALQEADVTVSSTKIRAALTSGDVSLASRMLGYDYSLRGAVVSGNGYGRKLGFPTANMRLYEPLKMIPGNGVYAVRVEVLGRQMYGMTNIGLRPTVTHDTVPVIETNIFDFDEQIYGLDINVSFLAKMRDEVKFGSVDELKVQLAKDRELCLKNVQSAQ